MCQNASSQASNLLKAEEPTLTGVLALLGQTSTPAGIAIVTAYNAAVVALANWKQGTAAQNVLQLLGDFTTAFNALASTLPLPPEVDVLVNLIAGGIAAVIGIINANSPAPAAPAGAATPELAAAAQTFHAHAAGADAQAKVTALTGVKLSHWDMARAALGDTHVAANRYKSEWNKAVDVGNLPATLKVA